MPSSVLTGAIYGTGVYGTSKYGSFGVVVSVDGVSGQFILNDTLEIYGDALHLIDTPNTDPLDSFVGSVSVTADANTAVTGVSAASALGSLIIEATTIISVTGVAGNEEIGSVSVSGDATANPEIPFLGDQLLLYMTVPVILGDANITVNSVEATGQVEPPSVFASSNTLVTGVNTTSNVGTVSLETNNYLDVSGIEIVSSIGSPVIIAKATVTITGVFATCFVGSVTILENEVQIPPAVVGSFSVGTVVITTTVFNFNAVASQYSRNRTAYIPRKPTAKERTVIIPAGQ